MKGLAAGLAFVYASVLCALALAFFLNGLVPLILLPAALAGVAAAAAAWLTTRPVADRPPGPWDWALLAVFALASLRAFLWLIGERGDEVFVLSPNNLGDMSLHLNFIRYLASGVPFWPESPILTGAPLTYPLGADLFNSLLELSGVGTFRGLIWVGLAGAGFTAFALWRWGGAFTLAAFLFNGGLAGFVFFQTGRFEDFQTELVWKNLFLSMFVTQRGLLVALPAGLLLLTCWREEFFRGRPPAASRWLQGTLYAAMPLFSLHTFIFLSAMLAAVFVFRGTSRRTLGLFVAAAFLPATACVLLITGGFYSSGGMHQAWGWILNGKDGVAFLKDFGLTLPLGAVTVYLALRGPDVEARCFSVAAAALFLLCCVVSFSRWEWDNMKLMMWCWLVLAPYLWTLVLRPLHWPAQAALCFVLFFSGAASLLGGLDSRHGYSLARRSELAAWQAAVAAIPATDRFAAMPDYNHPLILLGRKVSCGYDGHLWSHGLDYGEKMALTKAALRDGASWPDAAPQLDVQWAALRTIDRPEAVPRGLGTLTDLRAFFKPASESPTPPPPPPQSVDLSW